MTHNKLVLHGPFRPELVLEKKKKNGQAILMSHEVFRKSETKLNLYQ